MGYPYTRSGNVPDKQLKKILDSAAKAKNPICPDCKVQCVVRGYGEMAWTECPVCHRHLGNLTLM